MGTFWNIIIGVVVVLLVLSGLFDAIEWKTNLVAIAIVVAIWLIGLYNGFIRLKNRVREAWSDIEVQLKRRYDLIPNLISTVKGYASHEKGVFDAVTSARAKATQTQIDPTHMTKENLASFASAQGELASSLGRLIAVAENYPDLKANTNFLELQRELSDTENKIQAARRFYNSTVQEMNNAVQQFPSNVIAGMFGFKDELFFDADEKETAPVTVSF